MEADTEVATGSAVLFGRRRSLAIERRQRRRAQRLPLHHPAATDDPGRVSGVLDDLAGSDHARTFASDYELTRVFRESTVEHVSSRAREHGRSDFYVYCADADLDTVASDTDTHDDAASSVVDLRTGSGGRDDLRVGRLHPDSGADTRSLPDADAGVRVSMAGADFWHADDHRDRYGRERDLTCC